MSSNSLCAYLDWDSSFFKKRIARVTLNRLSSETTRTILQWCSENLIECLYFLCDSDHAETVALCELNEFHLVDIRVTMNIQPGTVSPSAKRKSEKLIILRDYEENDRLTLEAIAQNNHIDSRFYYDSNFPRAFCDKLYGAWLEKSCQNQAGKVFVAEMQNQAVGYITCGKNSDNEAAIGLLGVSPQAQGHGIGQLLINASINWAQAEKITRLSVVTQGRNVKAQRAYQKCGFQTVEVKLWYHKWFQ